MDLGDAVSDGYYTAAEAAEITAIPRSTIHYWVRTGLVEPSVSLARPMLFSFIDLRDLSVIDRLRGKTSTIKIRRGIDHLREHEGVAHVVTANCYLDPSGEVVWIPDGDDEEHVVVSKGGQLMFSLKDVWADLGADMNEAGIVIGLSPGPRITIDPDVRGGTPVIAGTRIPTALIAELLAAERTTAEIMTMYPLLSEEDVRSAAAWESQRAAAA